MSKKWAGSPAYGESVITSQSISPDQGAISGVFDNYAGRHRFAIIGMEFKFASSAPIAGKTLEVFLLYRDEYTGGGTGYTDGSGAIYPAIRPTLIVIPRLVTTQQMVIIPGIPIEPFKFEVLLWNKTDQAVTNPLSAHMLRLQYYDRQLESVARMIRGIQYHRRARYRQEAVYPTLWDGLEAYPVPAFGDSAVVWGSADTRSKLIDCSPALRPCTFTRGTYNYWSAEGPYGGSYYQLDGYNAGVLIDTPLAIDRDMTIFCTYRADFADAGRPGALACNGQDVSTANLFLGTNYGGAGKIQFAFMGYIALTSTATFTANTWHSIAVRRWGVPGAWNVDMWIDGRIDGRNSGGFSTPTANGDLRLCGTGNGGGGHYGYVGPTAIWRRKLNDIELAAMMADPFAPLRRVDEDSIWLDDPAFSSAGWHQFMTQVA